jgi:hypothetical protein
MKAAMTILFLLRALTLICLLFPSMQALAQEAEVIELPPDEEDELEQLIEESTREFQLEQQTDSMASGLNEQNKKENYQETAILQGLNKVTARTSILTASIGTPIKFGTIELTVKLCWRSSPEEKPDNKALIEVMEQKTGEEKEKIFYGWMFSSSPALSALEHPVYDIRILECKESTRKKNSL